MTDDIPRTSVTNYFFILLLFAGVTLFVFSFFLREPQSIFSGIRQISAGFLCIGIGEWINHPLQKTLTCQDRWNFIFTNIRHRRRQPSALGNLFEIGGLILIFTGLADYI